MKNRNSSEVSIINNAINAKIRAMSGRLLKEHDYKMLSSLTTHRAMAAGLRCFPAYSSLEGETGEAVCQGVLKLLQNEYIRVWAFIRSSQGMDYRMHLPAIAYPAFCGAGISGFVLSWKHIKAIKDKTGREALLFIKGTEIDLHNIMRVYRLKKYHNISGGAAYPYLIPIHFKLSEAALGRFAEATAHLEASFEASLEKTPYAAVFGEFDNLKNDYFRAMVRYMIVAARRWPSSEAVVVFRYFFRKAMEAEKIIAIAEALYCRGIYG